MEIVPTLAALETLRPQWSQLWHDDLRATPFQSPEWLLSWARHFAPDRVQALAVRSDHRLLALLPFFTWQNKLLIAGTGPSDYAGALFAPSHESAATPLLARLCAIAEALGCPSVDLQQLRSGSPLLQAMTPPGWQSSIVDGECCPIAKLAGSDGLDGISARRKKNLSYAARAMSRVVAHHSELVRVDGLRETLAEIAEIHARRWGAREESGVFADARMRAFLGDAVRDLATADRLRLHVLRAGAELAAAALVMCGRADAHLYLCTFDTEWSRYSPGLQTIVVAMQHAAREGAQRFHFLRGREPYKFQLGASETPTWHRRLSRGAPIAA